MAPKARKPTSTPSSERGSGEKENTRTGTNVEAIAATPLVETVAGRSFATLDKTAVRVTAALTGGAQSVAFTPRLDFREPGQFGAVDCTIDFSYQPRRSRSDAVAAQLLAGGVQMKGTSSAHLVFAASGGPIELTAGLIESALVALLLR